MLSRLFSKLVFTPSDRHQILQQLVILVENIELAEHFMLLELSDGDFLLGAGALGLLLVKLFS